jgi:hypothetical protein
MQKQDPLSAGSIIKTIVEINPQLTVQDIAHIIRSSLQKGVGDQFAGAGDEINEAKAFALARATLKN